MKTQISTQDQTILSLMEKARIFRGQYSKENPIVIEVGSFYCKINPEYLDQVIDRYKKIVNKDCSKYVFRYNPDYNWRHNKPIFKEYRLETYLVN